MRKSLLVVLMSIGFYLVGGGILAELYAAVTAIAPNDHPNLYFNQEEINRLRQAILVDRSPQYAVDCYNSIKGTSPANKPSNMDNLTWMDNYSAGRSAAMTNSKACFSYMIEPTSSKANALKNAVLSWTATPGGNWGNESQQGGHIHFVIAWMYDLIYNAGVLSASEKAGIDSWCASKSTMAYNCNTWAGFSTTINKESSVRQDYQNWWQWDFHSGVVLSMMSHDQSKVDRCFQTSVPEDYFSTSIMSYCPDTRDLKNMVNGLVFPSGYNFDGYSRGYGFDAPNDSYNGEHGWGQGQHYHFFAALPAVFGVEAASHNGFDAWSYKNNALKRTFVIAKDWAHDAWRRKEDGSDCCSYNWLPSYWTIYRHYPDDPVIKAAVNDSRSMDPLLYVLGNSAPLWGALGDISSTTKVTDLSVDEKRQPAFSIIPNFSNTAVAVKFKVPSDQQVSFSVYDLKGELVSVLLDHKTGPGEHSFELRLPELSAGIYVTRLQAGAKSLSKRIVLLK